MVDPTRPGQARVVLDAVACVQSVRPPYRLGWLDSIVVSQDARTGALLLGDPPPEQRDGHSSAGVYLGNMFVTEVTRRLKQRGVPVRIPPPLTCVCTLAFSIFCMHGVVFFDNLQMCSHVTSATNITMHVAQTADERLS